ncbi:SlyX family protein [Oceanicola sp. 22II-s10i]|uniref:SlyX family protein n=1 Tax=Oceanicola sp. 22II-s10i TaxID=1317116 RepID=UPI00112FDE0F|nr:SlyX family protein [Oceanicola sp. 22II-s10i]
MFRKIAYISVFSSAALMTGGLAAPALADVVHLDDVIIDGSLCVGFDCVNNESFGFDTIRLKENNVRIKFQDTSTGSFPSRDWQLTANDTASGGLNKFSIDDIDGARTPFTIEAGAPSHSLYVDDGGRIGMGTSSPSVELHTVDGDTPTLRLQQDTSSGFAAQTWDLAGNETSFFIRDASNGSTLPFRIRPSAPSNALVIDTDGDVGVGTLTSDASLHVKSSDGTTRLLIEETSGIVDARELMTLKNNGIVFFTLQDSSIAAGDDTGQIWNVQNQSGEFRVTTAPGGAGDIEMRLDVSGNLTIEGELFTAGSCSAGCDRVFDEDYPLPTIAEQAAMMRERKHLPNVGPTSEDGPFNITAMTGGMLNELEKAHLYIAQLNDRIADQDREIARMAGLEATVAQLTERLERVEAQR